MRTFTPNTIYGPVFGAAYGGAIGNGSLGTLVVSCSLFTGNKAQGGLRHTGSSLRASATMGFRTAAPSAIGIPPSSPTRRSPTTSPSAAQPIPGVDGGFGIGGAVGSGGPFAHSTAMTIRRCVFNNNQAIGADAGPGNMAGSGVGGALTNGYSEVGSTMTITDSTFTANQATGGNGGFAGVGIGGAMNLESPCTTNIANCTFTC